MYHKNQPNVGKYICLHIPILGSYGQWSNQVGGGMPDIFLNHTIFDMENPGTRLKFLPKTYTPPKFNSEFTPEKWCLEDYFPIGFR